MSINLVWRTDVHMADKGPSSRLDDWPTAVLDKLSQVREIAAGVGAAAILDGGDFFHIKSPTRNSHALVHRTAEHHQGYPCPVYCTPGNHDSVYGDYSFLPQQPLGVLYSTGVFQRLYDEHEVYFYLPEGASKPLEYPYNRKTGGWGRGNPFAIPDRQGPVVRVVGIPYHGSSYDTGRFFDLVKGEEDFLVCTAHVLASEGGGKMFEGEDILRYEDLLDTAPDVYCFGHWHMDQGVTEIDGKHFVNVGSLTRGSLSQDELRRKPAAVVLGFSNQGINIEVRRLRVKPAEEVFDVEGRARQVKRQVEMDAFVTRIKASLQPSDGGKTLAESIADVGEITSDVRERALGYLEQV